MVVGTAGDSFLSLVLVFDDVWLEEELWAGGCELEFCLPDMLAFDGWWKLGLRIFVGRDRGGR